MIFIQLEMLNHTFLQYPQPCITCTYNIKFCQLPVIAVAYGVVSLARNVIQTLIPIDLIHKVSIDPMNLLTFLVPVIIVGLVIHTLDHRCPLTVQVSRDIFIIKLADFCTLAFLTASYRCSKMKICCYFL